MVYAADPVGWVFADECHRARRGRDGFITPTGARIHRIFCIGVLTEVQVQNSRAVEARVSDPTGGFSISVNRSCPHVADLLAATEPPAFIAFSGELVQKGTEEIRVIADSCKIVQRSDRDRFIHLCAEDTIRRLEAADDLSDEQREIAEMVLRALSVAVEVKVAAPVDRREQMIGILERLSGAKGALLDEVIRTAGEFGVNETEVKAVLTELLEAGDCYMPTKGTIRLL
jgi:hypothetical protein